MSSFTKKSRVVDIDGHQLNLISIANLNLFIITDMSNIAPNWIQVLYVKHNQIYTTKTLLGSDESQLAPICRYLAQTLIDGKSATIGAGAGLHDTAGDTTGAEDLVLTFNISLKSLNVEDMDVVRELAKHLLDL